ncbi:melibiase [Kineococcus xinjiangensis]|uniref:Melibiase n=1 Tax=Kineococcus xinjiangensis TaxID=512762 RepID=A0A2S6IUE4_9ACTN|nr:alpha-galactosidase [Kineococcus xinjiangensis]PPK97892.1 melibiase [Kineococcus xinjiangensis]
MSAGTAVAGGVLRLAHAGLEVVLAHDPDGPVRIARLGVPGAAAELPGDQPAVEVVTVDAGRAPATNRLAGGAVSRRMRYAGHRLERTGDVQALVVEQVEQGGSLRTQLRLELHDGAAAVRARVTTSVDAGADAPRQLLAVAPLALGVALGPAACGDPRDLLVSLAESQWVGEGRWRTLPLREALPDLRLERHETGARGCLSQASQGLWSTGRALPVGVLATAAPGDGAWAWQVESTAGWRWEVGEHHSGAYLAASGPTDVDHGWSVGLEPGKSHTTPAVALAVGADLEGAAAALTDLRRATRRPHPDAAALRVVFNDYMNTLMGDPTTERLLPLIDAAAEAGAEVFCIDAGWYDDTDGWWSSVGAWEPSTTRFPGGLQAVLDRIRDRGLVAGLWLEPEVVGVDSPVADRLPADAFLGRRGQRVVEHGRYHLDLRHPSARAHLDATVDRLVAMGVGYLKLDHNINPVAGTDVGADSPAEGLAGHAAAHRDWLTGVLDRHPGLVLENCASGAMRADPELLSLLQLQSTSDQQDPSAYPPIAASAPLAMLPEVAANWAYPQPAMSEEEAAFTLCTGLLGRLYLSGHVDEMSTAQRSLVAEAVAAHKRIRADVAAGHPRWPLGLEQWSAPWVALAVDGGEATHLTLWRRPVAGAAAPAVVEVPLPQHAGQDLVVTTTFPTRLAPWRTRWDAERAVLVVEVEPGVEVEGPAARTLRLTRGRPVQRVLVDAGRRTGAVHGGATGMLYGLVEPGVPTPALLAGARPRTVAQKSPGGAQHPGGDAAVLAEGFAAAGGEDVYVYVQDALACWPYEDVGIDAYLPVLRDAVAAVAGREDRHRFVWVPFNEGDWIWYPDWSSQGRDRFLAHWDAAVAQIRAVDPQARIAGPNEAAYHPGRMRDFLRHARDSGTLPDVVTWHELQPSSLETYRSHHEHLRELEREFGLEPRPVCIDEYGNRRDMSVPSQLLQWVEAFESTKVDADLAFWTLAGNLDDHAVGAAAPNGGWWLLHWYASLRGETLEVRVPHPGVRDSLRALAALDRAEGSAVVLLGGTADDVELRVEGLPPGRRYRARTSVVTWSGYQGISEGPCITGDAVVTATDGCLDLRVDGGDPTAVNRVDLLPAELLPAEPPPGPWQVTVGVDPARTVDAELVRHGDDPQHYHGTGTSSVLRLPLPTSRVDFEVTVPAEGEYLLGIGYGTDARPGTVALAVDDGPVREVPLAPTLERRYTARADVPVRLAAGRHRVSVAASGPSGHLAGSDVAVDHLRVRAVTAAVRHEAVLARRGAGCCARDGGGVVVPAGERVTFFAVAARTGAHRLSLRADAPADAAVELRVDGRPVPLSTTGGGAVADVALGFGVAQVDVVARGGPVLVHHLLVAALAEEPGDVRVLDAPGLRLRGAAHLTDGPVPAVAGFGAGGAAVVPLDGTARGPHLVTLLVSNAHRLTGHDYNTDAVVQHLRVGQVGAEVEVPVHHTVHWDGFQEVSAVVDLDPSRGPLLVAGRPAEDGPGARLAGVRLRASSPARTEQRVHR